MTKRIFIDGASGTTAFSLKQALEPFIENNEIDLIEISDTRDVKLRQKASREADLVILCLPDDVTKQTIPFLRKYDVQTIDASSAHRDMPIKDKNFWAYGFPELNEDQPRKIANARFVSNPGCFATGAISILTPLIKDGILSKDAPIIVNGVAGYTTGGKKMVGNFEKPNNDDYLLSRAFSQYNLTKPHRHIEEIKNYSGLNTNPVFTPTILPIARGMIVSIPFNKASIPEEMRDQVTLETIQRTFEKYYNSPDSKVEILPLDPQRRSVNFGAFKMINEIKNAPPLDTVKIAVTGWDDGNEPQFIVYAMLDNLGKGAATQAVQNMKLMLKL